MSHSGKVRQTGHLKIFWAFFSREGLPPDDCLDFWPLTLMWPFSSLESCFYNLNLHFLQFHFFPIGALVMPWQQSRLLLSLPFLNNFNKNLKTVLFSNRYVPPWPPLVTDKRNRRSASWFFRLTVHNPSNGYSNWQNHPLWANINLHSQWSAGTPAQLATWNPLLLLITYKSFLPSWCIFWKTALRPYFQNFYGGVEHSDQPTISIH